MLNERQELLLDSMLMFCYSKRAIISKRILNNSLSNFAYLKKMDDIRFFKGNEKSKFNSSVEARELTDDFLAITLDQNNPYIVVSSKSGVYITKDIAEKNAYILRLRDEANKKHTLASLIAKLPLNGQIKGEV